MIEAVPKTSDPYEYKGCGKFEELARSGCGRDVQRARQAVGGGAQGAGDFHRLGLGGLDWGQQDPSEVPGDARAEWHHGAWELLGVRWVWPRGGQAGSLLDVLRVQRDGDQRDHARALEQLEC